MEQYLCSPICLIGMVILKYRDCFTVDEANISVPFNIDTYLAPKWNWK